MNNGARHNLAQQSRDITLDVLRGVAILIVVFGHAIQASLLNNESSFIWSKIVLNFQMPLLFWISGYSAGFSYPCRNTKKFMIKKMKRLLIPYIAWEIVHYIVACIVPGDYRVFAMTGFIKEFFVSDFWFLRVLFIYYLVIWGYNLIFNTFYVESKKLQFVFLLSGSIPIWVMTRVKLIGGSLSIWYYGWFLVGLLFFNVKHFVKLDLKKISKITLLIVLTVILALAFVLDAPPKILTVLLVAEVATTISLVINWIPNTVREYLIHIGKNTLPIYGIHWCILFSPIFRLGGYQVSRKILPLYVNALVVAVLWMIVCEVVIWIMLKYRIMRSVFLGMR